MITQDVYKAKKAGIAKEFVNIVEDIKLEIRQFETAGNVQSASEALALIAAHASKLNAQANALIK